jgi:hypothetical protein
VLATANHFWLDVLAGIVLAAVTMALVYRGRVRDFIVNLL